MFDRFLAWRGKHRAIPNRRPGSRQRGRLPAGRSRVPLIELLEQRMLLTGNTYNPSATVADSSNSSDNNLRSAISAANAENTTGTDTINLTAGTYALTLGELEFDPGHGPLADYHRQRVERSGRHDHRSAFARSGLSDRLRRFGHVREPGNYRRCGHRLPRGTGCRRRGRWHSLRGQSDFEQCRRHRQQGDRAIKQLQCRWWRHRGIRRLDDPGQRDQRQSAPAGPGSGDFAYGGGLFVSTVSAVSVTDTTIANNTSQGGAGGGGGLGGAAYLSVKSGTTTKFTDDTITANQALGGAEGGVRNGGGLEFDTGGLNSAATGAATTVEGCTFSYNTAVGPPPAPPTVRAAETPSAAASKSTSPAPSCSTIPSTPTTPSAAP